MEAKDNNSFSFCAPQRERLKQQEISVRKVPKYAANAALIALK
jgi:hypothetical protein